MMRNTLRRSCNACAKSKLGCGLRTPQCSRCLKKKSICIYANQPLTGSLPEQTNTSPSSTSFEVDRAAVRFSENSLLLIKSFGNQSDDPFESYPQTRLPRAHVQRLIRHFLSNIAFQYYPLDLNITSNPFVVSWWPLALADPALFHVSLQTTSWDMELQARKGFMKSEILMVDSVSLVRRGIEDPMLAYQDETLDSVVTLAAIEFGKGNVALGKMHIEGVKCIVQMRGGMRQVKLTSPLTARMVSWVSLIVMQYPQFPTQDDLGVGDGIAPITQWHKAITNSMASLPTPFNDIHLDPSIHDDLFRLRNLFHESQYLDLSSTDFHDLTCFVLHKLLLSSPHRTVVEILQAAAISECVRYALILNMLIVHGPAYFSHARLQYNMTLKLKYYLKCSLVTLLPSHGSLAIWLLTIGMVASDDTTENLWFQTQAETAASNLRLYTWEVIFARIEEVLWLRPQQAALFRERWADICAIAAA